MGSLNPSTDYSMIFNTIVNQDVKKDANISKLFYEPDFNTRLFKKLFSLYGQAFYANTVEVIKKLMQDLNKKENQSIFCPYFTGLLKSCLTLHNFANPKEVQDFAENSILLCFYNVSKDLFNNWVGYIIWILQTNSHLKIQSLLKKVVDQKFEQQEDNPKFTRRLWMLRYMVKFNGYHLKYLTDSLLDEYKNALCQDSKQILEF